MALTFQVDGTVAGVLLHSHDFCFRPLPTCQSEPVIFHEIADIQRGTPIIDACVRRHQALTLCRVVSVAVLHDFAIRSAFAAYVDYHDTVGGRVSITHNPSLPSAVVVVRLASQDFCDGGGGHGWGGIVG